MSRRVRKSVPTLRHVHARGVMFTRVEPALERPTLAKRARRRVRSVTESRLRPGRQGVQRIYRLAKEKAMIGEYEYLESIGVSRAQALQVMSRASAVFEQEVVRRGEDPREASFGAAEMERVVRFLTEQGVETKRVGFLVIKHPAVLAYDVEGRLRPLFAYMESTFERDARMFVEDVMKRPSLLGLRADENARRMVEYLLENGSSKEEAVEYLLRTL